MRFLQVLYRAVVVSCCTLGASVTVSSAKAQPSPKPTAIHADLAVPADVRWVLPVRSLKLSPGPVEPRALNMPGLKPFFLVGEDSMSLQWLQANAQRLESLEAAGLVVNVTDVASLQRIQSMLPSLTLLPVSGDDIGERLQLEHYPVLITPTALEQ